MSRTIHVVLVELKIPENVGFIARLVKNFGVENLWLYRCRVSEESYQTAANAKDVLERAKIVDDLSFLRCMNLVIGTTGVEGGDYRYLRKPLLTPEEMCEVVRKGGEIAVLFGREDFGLLNEELEMCHVLVRIPTSESYPVMNVSHAAAIVLYFLSRGRFAKKPERFASVEDIEVLLSNVEEMLRLTEFPKHRIRRTVVVFRRLLGRAKPRRDEILTINGIFRKTISFVKRRCQGKSHL